jgi:hypothetical protein
MFCSCKCSPVQFLYSQSEIVVNANPHDAHLRRWISTTLFLVGVLVILISTLPHCLQRKRLSGMIVGLVASVRRICISPNPAN